MQNIYIRHFDAIQMASFDMYLLLLYIITRYIYYCYRIPILGSGSDFEPFITKVGVTCVDLRYHYDESLGISSYPLYHSVYETFHLVNDIMDPDFVVCTLK